MSAVHDLKETLEQLQTAQFVTTMLRDISATRLQSIRSAYMANEVYYTELHELMRLVKSYAAAHAPHTLYKNNEAGRVYVALTSNKRFYGILNHRVLQHYFELRQSDQTAAGLIVGQTGRNIVNTRDQAEETEFFSFAKDTPKPEETLKLIESLAGYTEVVVVHPTFVSSFTQNVAVTDISHVPKESVKETPPLDYLFEPDIPDMLKFFTKQIRLVLFERVLLETELALTGARLMKMQRARERAKELVGEQRHTIYKEVSTVKSMRLLETFTGFAKKDL